MFSSCLLYQNPTASVTIIDIPRSLELSQGRSVRRLLSAEPLQEPFPSHEPKSSKGRAKLGERSIDDLIVQKHLEFSLAEIKQNYQAEWCLPRVTEQRKTVDEESSHNAKTQKPSFSLKDRSGREEEEDVLNLSPPPPHVFATTFFQNQSHTSIPIRYSSEIHATLPPQSTFLKGSISTTLPTFIQHAPKFDLIILDPPWPNRSARRKGDYEISYNTSEIRSLLSSIPLEDHIYEEGYIGVWITNKAIFRELILEVFTEWGVELVEEWIWLKVTAKGEPVSALDGLWKKPYEILLVARKGGVLEGDGGVKRRVVMGVPDLHSRKPNLKSPFEVLMQKKPGTYEGLEIFARNLTEGWWGWGNEVLKFQEDEYWADSQEEVTPVSISPSTN